MNTTLILGGYGGTGRPIARHLLQATDVRVIVAGRDAQKAARFAAELNQAFPGERATSLAADAADPESLRAAFRGVNLVLVCLPTTRHTEAITRAALAAGSDYLDVHYPNDVIPILKRLEPEIRSAGRCFITQGGFHTGLVAPLVRFAAPHFDHYRKASVGVVMNFRFNSSIEAATQFMEEMSDYQGKVFVGGRWRRPRWRDFRKFDFGRPFGGRTCAPLTFPEMEALPAECGLEELGCYVAGFNWVTDYLLFPLAMLLGKVKRGLAARSLARWLAWAMTSASHPPYGVVMRLEAEGEKEGQPLSVLVELRHGDAYEFTAIPVVACVRQYLDGSIARPGVWLMGEAVDPARLVEDLEQMGIDVETTVREASPAPVHERV